MIFAWGEAALRYAAEQRAHIHHDKLHFPPLLPRKLQEIAGQIRCFACRQYIKGDVLLDIRHNDLKALAASNPSSFDVLSFIEHMQSFLMGVATSF